MVETLEELNSKFVAAELLILFWEEVESGKPAQEVIINLRGRLSELTEKHGQDVTDEAISLMKGTGEVINKILAFTLTDQELIEGINKKLN